MSGGSMDYAYLRVIEAADRMRVTTPLRSAFRDHLHLVAEALRSIEWVDSGDMSEDQAEVDMRACMPLVQPDVERP